MRHPQVALAVDLAVLNHGGQKDKAGDPYLGHLARVAEAVRHLGWRYEATAWLHDIVEDTEITLDDLFEHGIDAAVVGAVWLLTDDGSVRIYARRVGKVLASDIATAVKRADMLDNADEGRLSYLDEATAARLREKYRRGLTVLELAEKNG